MSEQPRIHQRRDNRGPDRLSAESVLQLLPSAQTIIENAKNEGDFERAKKKRTSKKEITDPELFSLANVSLAEMIILETAARNPEKWHIPPDLAQSLKLVVVFSAPGTYTESVKEDRHQGQEYAIWMDRQRADIAARLSIVVAGIKTGRDLSAFAQDDIIDGFAPQLRKLREVGKESIIKSDLSLLYLGTPVEVRTVRAVLNSPSSYIPKEAVEIIEGKSTEYNTFNQVEDLKRYLQQNELKPDDALVFVMGFQTVRTMRYCQQIQAIPSGVNVYVFPTSTHQAGIAQYAQRETRGALAGLINQEASFSPFPYVVLGR